MYSNSVSNNYFCQYPPPTQEIADRIVQEMFKAPQFYFRVLELMRSMNLPSPFCNHLNVCNRSVTASQVIISPTIAAPASHSADYEEEEETDEPGTSNSHHCGSSGIGISVIGSNRAKLKRILKSAKSGCVKSIKGQSNNTKITHRRISIHLKSNSWASKYVDPEKDSPGNFGTFNPPSKDHDSMDERSESPPFDFKTCLSLSDIRRHVISNDEQRRHQLFKKYNAGVPSSRLYVKNVSRKATKDDLRRIFGTFATPGFEDSFDVCFMTKGKLHGQAFITFANDHMARKALDATNGYVLHEKPLVVVFARSKR